VRSSVLGELTTDHEGWFPALLPKDIGIHAPDSIPSPVLVYLRTKLIIGGAETPRDES
jgi:hypothetical protein